VDLPGVATCGSNRPLCEPYSGRAPCRPTLQGCYTRHMSVPGFARIRVYLSTAVLLLAAFPMATPAQDASGHFEVYCDGVGFFLAKVDGAPAPGKLLLFLYTGFPPGFISVPKEVWTDAYVYRNGCVADGKCEVFASGKVWLDDELTKNTRRVSGKYEIERGGQRFRGSFAAKERYNRHPVRICE